MVGSNVRYQTKKTYPQSRNELVIETRIYGAKVGCDVGYGVGSLVGPREGTRDGAEVGTVGTGVRSAVGPSVGTNDGLHVNITFPELPVNMLLIDTPERSQPQIV